MTITTSIPTVAHSLYRDVHKGIRSELFAVTEQAGRLDPSVDEDRAALAAHVADVAAFLVSHAEHEDAAILPTLQSELPALAEQIATEHETIDGRLVDLQAWANAAGDRADMDGLYLELASFTTAFLAHQDVEERLVMPALEAAVGVDAVLAIHEAIISSIPPDEMAKSLAIMLRAMNVDDRTELLGGMQAGAPPEVFAGVWGLAGSVLPPAELAAVGRRLGL
jgi:hypothetical protein